MMAAGNPNWHNMQQGHSHSNSPLFSLLHHQLSLHGGSPNNSSSSSSSSSSTSSSSSSSLPFNPLLDEQSAPQDFPQSWNQLLLSGLASGTEEEGLGLNNHLQGMNPSSFLDHPKVTPSNENMLFGHDDDDHHQHQLIKQEAFGHGHDMNYHLHHQMHNMRPSTWSHMVFPVSSPKSCVTTLSSNNNNNNSNNNNFMDFSSNSCKDRQHAQHSSDQCNSSDTTGGVPKKPRVQSSSVPPLKVRKEKLGDRITALHQLVSPFGKTDTASVLLETIGCIRFLQGQIQALSSPYLGIPPSKNHHCHFNYVAKDETLTELRSKGLCLVPTHLVGTDNNTAAEYWAPSIAGGF